jgi:hypothetical protein
VKTKYWLTSHKYDLELPTIVSSASQIDERTGTDFLRIAIETEIRNVCQAIDFLDDNDKSKVPPGFTFVDTYFVFDIQMDLTWKARLCDDSAGVDFLLPIKVKKWSFFRS